MHLTIERGALLKALSHVQSVVEKRNTIPILSNILLEADGAVVSMTATDMDLTVVETCTCSVEQSGALTVPAHTLYDIFRKLPDGAQVELKLNPETQQVQVCAGRSNFLLPVLPKDDFPIPGDETLPVQFSLPGIGLAALIDRTRFAISTEETRYYLNGIYLHPAERDGTAVLRAVATDGHRLAQMEVVLPAQAGEMPGVIIPRKTINEVRRLLDSNPDEVGIEVSDTKMRFTIGSVVLTSKLIDGTYPDYDRVIPTNNDKILEMDCKVFAEAVDRVSIISSDKSRAVKLAFDDNFLTLTANNPDHGTATEVVEVSYQDMALEIGFNSRYLLDVALQVGDGRVQFIFADGTAPTLVKDMGDAGVLYVLMPMRV